MVQSDHGAVMALRHFSMQRPITCTLISGDTDKFFTVMIKGPLGTYFNISKGDPIIFAKPDNNTCNVYGGFVLSKIGNYITISPDMTSFSVERRKTKSFPVSLLGYVRHVNYEENIPAWVKDISYEGLRIATETEFSVNDKVELSISIYDKLLDVSGMIVRRASLFGRNEYGIMMSFSDKNSLSAIKDSIDYLVAEEKKLMENHLLNLEL